MEKKVKTKRRGFVMTGGGAKGLYEAGVIHAFHLLGMEFDVITGSSIGAMNSVFFAEYLFHKRQLPWDVQGEPLKAIEAMDGIVKSFHHAWLTMPDKQIINDRAEGPLGLLKDDLLRFNLSLPQVTRLLWWWTDSDRHVLPPPKLWPDFLRLVSELAERLGAAEILRILKHHRHELLREVLRTYLARFDLEHSMVPEGEDYKVKEVFTSQISPLRAEHLSGNLNSVNGEGTQLYRLVDPDRTLRDYADAGINVRLTRANYRTGRLEISSYVTPKEFAAFLDKHAWRIEKFGPEKLPLGSFRLKVPGNPLALNAAICSGRFPGVFRPYRLEDIYPTSDEDNKFLYSLLGGWLADANVEAKLKPIFKSLKPGEGYEEQDWSRWKQSTNMRRFFPQPNDIYVDGGAIDNTPYTAAVDFVRDSLQLNDGSVRDEMLELYVVYLEPEPKVEFEEETDPFIFEVVSRTLALVNAAAEKGRANVFDTINTFGMRAEQIAQVLDLVMDSYQETMRELDEDKRGQVEENILKKAQALWKRDFSDESPKGILKKISNWADEKFVSRLPLQVETVKIHPQEMPLNTLQFTERLGYKKENAIQMLAMGCYNTLDSLRAHLEARVKDHGWESLDEHDRRALILARKWTGDLWHATSEVPDPTGSAWRCQWTTCAFHAHICPHGAMAV